MTAKVKRKGFAYARPKADFGSIFTTYIAPAANAIGAIADSASAKSKDANNQSNEQKLPESNSAPQDEGVVNENTTIPSDPTKAPVMRLGGRRKAWIGAAIGAATSIAGSLFGASAQKKAQRKQESIEDWNKSTQEAASMSTALNNSSDYQEDYLRQFRTAARLGKTLGAKKIYITDGGDADKIDNNTFLLRGGSHEDVNETGQTGIGINVGGNEVEAEGGEVAQRKGNNLRIFSAQPILGGMSPAQAVLRGYNKDNVFARQQAFKRRNGLKDDGSKAQWGVNLPWKDYATDRVNVNQFVLDGRGQKRRTDINNVEHIQDRLIDAGIPYNQRLGILSSIISESGGNPNANSGNGFRGLLQYSNERHPNSNNLDKQVDYIINTAKNYDATNWTYGGKRSGYNTGKEAYDAFWNSSTPEDVSFAFDRGYVRPKKLGATKLRVEQTKELNNYKTNNSKRNTPMKRFRQDYPYIARPEDVTTKFRLFRFGGDMTSNADDGNRSYPSIRQRSRLNSYNRPVKGIRSKAALGTTSFVPYNKRYTSIYDAPNYNNDDNLNGNNALGNSEVVVTASRIKPTWLTPNNDAKSLLKEPVVNTKSTGSNGNKSRAMFSSGDYIGLGIDTLAGLSTGLINYNAAGKYYLPDRAPIIATSKLPTNYNITPQLEEAKRQRERLTSDIYNNTSSSVAALNRARDINLATHSDIAKLYATKENEENKMLTEDAKNQQGVAAQNVTNQLARESEIAKIKNDALQSKADALNVSLSGLSQAWTNFWTAGRTAYEDEQARLAMVASSKDATPTKLIEMGVRFDPSTIAALYKTSKDEKTKQFYLNRLTDSQRKRYGIN
jgi:hypothetical protein